MSDVCAAVGVPSDLETICKGVEGCPLTLNHLYLLFVNAQKNNFPFVTDYIDILKRTIPGYVFKTILWQYGSWLLSLSLIIIVIFLVLSMIHPQHTKLFTVSAIFLILLIIIIAIITILNVYSYTRTGIDQIESQFIAKWNQDFTDPQLIQKMTTIFLSSFGEANQTAQFKCSFT